MAVMRAANNPDKAMRMAAEGRLAQALSSALRIHDAWFRTQAIAQIIECAPDDKVQYLTETALKAAKECRDAYQRVAVTAWVFAAVIQRGKQSIIHSYLVRVLAEVPNIEPPPSKVEALYHVWQVVGVVPKLRHPVQTLLIQACETAKSWRAGRIMWWVVVTIADQEKDIAQAERLWARMPDSQFKRKARRALDAMTSTKHPSIFGA